MRYPLLILLAFMAASLKPATGKAASSSNKDTATAASHCADESPASPMVFGWDALCSVLTIRVEGDSLAINQPDQAEYMCSHVTYPFDEDFILPEDMWRALGATSGLTVKAGAYPILKSERSFVIWIDMDGALYR